MFVDVDDDEVVAVEEIIIDPELGDEPIVLLHDGERASERHALFEQMYDYCRDRVLHRDPAEFDVNLAFDERGVLQACTFRSLSCADDCTQGIWISEWDFGAR